MVAVEPSGSGCSKHLDVGERLESKRKKEI